MHWCPQDSPWTTQRCLRACICFSPLWRVLGERLKSTSAGEEKNILLNIHLPRPVLGVDTPSSWLISYLEIQQSWEEGQTARDLLLLFWDRTESCRFFFLPALRFDWPKKGIGILLFCWSIVDLRCCVNFWRHVGSWSVFSQLISSITAKLPLLCSLTSLVYHLNWPFRSTLTARIPSFCCHWKVCVGGGIQACLSLKSQ